MSLQRGFAVAHALLLLACQRDTDPTASALTVSDLTLPTAIRDFLYTTSLSRAVSGSLGDHSWRLSQGSLPAGLTLTESGTVNGTPTENGTFAFVATVTSGEWGSVTGRFVVSVVDALSLEISTERSFAGPRDSRWRCEFTWTVAATGGRPTDRAYWEPSTVEWLRASDGARAVTQVSTQDFMDWFGEDQVIFDQVLSIPFFLASDGPFEATLNLRYSVTPTFAQATATSNIDCR